ncbi:MAG: hypothetical protein [Caudoviricetes sp.]|nr:MAG: hypothetical protein [Caudoviricetes sp.]
MYGDHISKSITAFMVFCAILGGLAVAVCAWVIPWLWNMVKPWIHSVTG